MNNNTDMKSVVVGWLALAVAFVCGKKYGYGKCKSEVKDIVLKQLIDEKKKKEEEGS
jgi:hypothetical protein